jgi:hypothetical protein
MKKPKIIFLLYNTTKELTNYNLEVHIHVYIYIYLRLDTTKYTIISKRKLISVW